MRILSLSLRGFRNLQPTHLDFEDQRAHFLLGRNGQGKTNLLEALGLLTALRSFRATDRKALVAWEAEDAQLHYRIDHDRQGITEVRVRLWGGRAAVQVDGETLPSYRAFVGLFPTVALSSHDIQFLRDGPAVRRRFLDLSLAAVDGSYLDDLRLYHQALTARNRLLKEGVAGSQITAFSKEMAQAASQIVTARQLAVREMVDALRTVYQRFAPASEEPALCYEPNLDLTSAEAWETVWREGLSRDRVLGVTRQGPHRDDLALRLNGKEAAAFASEGQQRGMVTALRLAQASWMWRRTEERPVLLADDILGELDPQRRRAFWNVLEETWQIFASGTSIPEGGPKWDRFVIAQGSAVREVSPP